MLANIISYALLIGLIVFFFFTMRRIMRRDNVINELIIGFVDRQTISKEELISRMYQYACNDFRLKGLIKKYNATEEDYTIIFDKLIYWANFKKRKRYIPVNAFFFYGSLKYLLTHKDDEAKPITMKMMNYFHF
ncbi:hypothetical protein D081_0894 [Anaerovibrio sp. JC8]|uniref:hypothetical protein n=1 Tax=Anaerovibrio sp. JC8 TaxID=1240085 RepID=UPI000A0CEA56|nr:hypothetical protein [Anaerovibrio sp. JC8]ORU00371.1 hypothetical protein D081_0894 [Anaerovibrio sp. JC8]